MNSEKSVTRRNFLKSAILAIGGLISAGFGLPGILYIVGPALKSSKTTNWIPIGSTSKIELGVPTLFKVNVQRKAGWIESEEEVAAFVLTDDNRTFIAMSNICTHLGCRIRWIADRQEFFCPCHNGVFNKQGQVVSGPPPRPLDQYEVKVENDQLFILGG